MKKLLGSAALAITLLSTGLQAGDRSFAEIYVECGLGGIIGKAAGGGEAGDILAIVTNITWDLGTTAISSDITSDDTCVNTEGLSAALINEGYDKLEEEIALGNGAYLDALKKVSHNQLDTTALRNEFAAMTATPEYENLSHYEKAEKLYNIVVK